jgi:hypothetical protein
LGLGRLPALLPERSSERMLAENAQVVKREVLLGGADHLKTRKAFIHIIKSTHRFTKLISDKVAEGELGVRPLRSPRIAPTKRDTEEFSGRRYNSRFLLASMPDAISTRKSIRRSAARRTSVLNVKRPML